jgi:branched-subunit amino acid transport protein AzlD
MVSVQKALVLTAIMGAVIFFCRVFPFLLFRGKGEHVEKKVGEKKEKSPFTGASRNRFLTFVEKVAPPAAMAVLAFNALALPVKDAVAGNPRFTGVLFACLPLLLGAAFTALSYVWKRNILISIFGGTIAYMAIGKLF